jgi:hypothetical protein
MRSAWILIFSVISSLVVIGPVVAAPTPHTCLSTVNYRIGDPAFSKTGGDGLNPPTLRGSGPYGENGSSTDLRTLIPPGATFKSAKVYLIGKKKDVPIFQCSFAKPKSQVPCPAAGRPIVIVSELISAHTWDNWDTHSVTIFYTTNDDALRYNDRLVVEYETKDETCSSAGEFTVRGHSAQATGVVIPKDATFLKFRSYAAKEGSPQEGWMNCDKIDLRPGGEELADPDKSKHQQNWCAAPWGTRMEHEPMLEQDGMKGWQMICHTDSSDARMCRGELVYSMAKAGPIDSRII